MQERFAQRGVALGRHQFLLDRPGLLVWDVAGVRHIPGAVRSVRCAQDPAAFPPGRGREPAGKCGRIPDCAQVLHQLQPDALANVVGVDAAQPVPVADRPDERGIPVDEGVPRLFIAVSGVHHQVSGR